ncbi:MAG: MFS transporter [Anaerolineae bacterium]|nr:MFS transporter [Anaerolineae bacterium]NUQ05667.1 MFS transporter [Anaerolineae bacterium]
METVSAEVHKRRWLIIGIILIGSWVGTLGNSMLPVALPTIVQDFEVSLDLGVWVISIYTLLIAVLMPIYGWLSDRYGYRRLYVITLVGLGVSFGLAALATSFWGLIGTRALQALFNAATLPAVMGIISMIFPKEERGVAMGAWATVNGAAHGFGPVISGALVENFGWQSIFVMNAAVTLVGAFLVFLVIPADHKETRRPFDFVGAFTLTAAMLVLMFVLSRGGYLGWGSPLTIGLWVGVVTLLSLFIFTERRVAQPFIELSLFRNARYVSIVAISSAQFFCLMGLPVLLSIFLIEVHHYSSSAAGLLIAPLASTLAISSPFGGRFADRVGFRFSILIGMAMVAIAAFTMLFWSAEVSPWVIVPTLILAGIGMGLTQSQAATGVTFVTRKSELGIALGVFNMFRFISGTFSATTFGILLEQAGGSSSASLSAIHLGFGVVVAAACIAVILATSSAHIRISEPSIP